jgi:hypothetical protein
LGEVGSRRLCRIAHRFTILSWYPITTNLFRIGAEPAILSVETSIPAASRFVGSMEAVTKRCAVRQMAMCHGALNP